MDKIVLLNKYLGQKKQELSKALEKAREARDGAPSAMESHSDTSRSQNERLVSALEEELKEIESYVSKINPLSLVYLEVKINYEIKKLLMVPTGLGGAEIDGIRLLSIDSPLGKQVFGKKEGDKLLFNDQETEILKVE
jgi:transcription elongation GreA/GreB family factor